MRGIIAVFVALTFGLGVFADNAEAGRLGGGKSFGGKNMFSQPQKRSTVQNPSKQENPSSAAAAPAAAGGATGAKAGMMGALGGLVAGGLLGALFFGGAFENINFMDILIFGLIAFIIFKLMSGRRRGMEPQAAAAGGYSQASGGYEPRSETAQQRTAQSGFDTDLLFRKDRAGVSSVPSQAFSAMAAREPSIPKGFDAANFLEGAKAAYARLQRAWDEGDLGDLRQFTTDKVFGEVQDQFRARQGDNRTEILDLNAQILGVQENGGDMEAAVLFTATLREFDIGSGENPEPVTAEEIWHFIKPRSSVQPTWYLDGIQQIED